MDNESKVLCNTKKFEQGFAYHEFSRKITEFVNMLLDTGEPTKTAIRTLTNVEGGVTLWLSRRTRQRWFIPIVPNKKRRHLYLMLTTDQPDLTTRINDSDNAETAITVRLPMTAVKKGRGNKGKYDGYVKFITKYMRDPCFDIVDIIYWGK